MTNTENTTDAIATATTTCIVRGCRAEFFLIPARGDVKHICLTHADNYMRASGHQNEPNYSVD